MNENARSINSGRSRDETDKVLPEQNSNLPPPADYFT